MHMFDIELRVTRRATIPPTTWQHTWFGIYTKHARTIWIV